MEGVQEVAEAFVQHYYAAFDGDRSMLQALYSEESLVSFEGKQAEGLENILTVVGSLQFQQVNRVLTTTDVQPVIVGGELMGILISILGQLQADADEAHGFNQVFLIRATPDGSWYIANETFRLAIHDVAT